MPPAADSLPPLRGDALPPQRLGFLFVAGLVLWLGLIVAGVTWTARWDHRAGTVGAVPPSWPAASQLVRAEGRHTLVVFAHPRCPCTVATLRELEKIVSRCQGRVDARVLFSLPQGATEDFTEGDLWQRARALPGVTVQADPDGREARLFDATTSGTVVLFDRNGALAFSGGITSARGHEGDNPGRAQVVALVQSGGAGTSGAPVFGCPLFDCPPFDRGDCCKSGTCAREATP